MSYQAFISYSHMADRDTAAALQDGLQQLAKPWYRLRAIRVFLDKVSLAVNPALWSKIQEALAASEYFILMASPAAADSPWVNLETKYWTEHRDVRKVLIVLTGGELAWSADAGDFDWDRTTALPPSLRRRFAEEPLFLDLRWARSSQDLSLQNPRFRNAVADLAAAVRSLAKDELVGEDVRQHRRVRRLAGSAVTLLAVLALAASLAAVVAYLQRTEAFRQRGVAEKQTALAEENAREATHQKRAAEDNAAEAQRQAGVALTQSRIARQQRDAALSRLLAARSQRNVYSPNKSLDVALLQAVAANQIAATAEAQESLFNALIATNRVKKFVQTPDTIVSLAVSPDGKTIATGHFRGQIRLWDARTLRGRLTLGSNVQRVQVVHSLSFSPDGATLASAANERIVLWDVRGGTETGVLSDDRAGRVTRMVWHPDGATLFSNKGGSILVWDVPGRKLRAALPAYRTEVTALAMSPGADIIASAGFRESGIRLWNTATLQDRGLLDAHEGQVRALAFNAEGTLLASGGQDSAIIVWELASGSERSRLDEQTDRVNVVAFAPGGKYLISGGSSGTIVLWDLAKRTREELLFGHTNSVSNLVFAHGGAELFSNAFDDTLIVWNLGHTRHREYLTGHERHVRTVAASPDGATLASAGDDGTVRLWNSASGEPGLVLKGHRGPVSAVAFSADGRVLASGGADDRRIILWDVAGSRQLRELEGHGYVTSLAFSRDRRWLASATGGSGVIYLREAGNGQELSDLRGHEGGVQALEFSRDSKMLVSGGRDGSFRLWDLQSKKETVAPRNAGGAVMKVAISPDGKTVGTSASFRGLVLLWDALGAGKPIEIESSPGFEHSIAISPDGKIFASTTGQLGLNILLWDTANRRQRAILEGPASTLAVAFTPDGKRLMSGHSNGYVTLWDVDVDGWQQRACDIANRNVSREEWKTFVSEDLPYRAICPEFPVPK